MSDSSTPIEFRRGFELLIGNNYQRCLKQAVSELNAWAEDLTPCLDVRVMKFPGSYSREAAIPVDDMFKFAKACSFLNEAHGNDCTKPLKRPLFDLACVSDPESYGSEPDHLHTFLPWVAFFCPRKLEVYPDDLPPRTAASFTCLVEELHLLDSHLVPLNADRIMSILDHVRVTRRLSISLLGGRTVVCLMFLPYLLEKHGIEEVSIDVSNIRGAEPTDSAAGSITAAGVFAFEAGNLLKRSKQLRHLSLAGNASCIKSVDFSFGTHLRSLSLKNFGENTYRNLGRLLEDPSCRIETLRLIEGAPIGLLAFQTFHGWNSTGLIAMGSMWRNTSVQDLHIGFQHTTTVGIYEDVASLLASNSTLTSLTIEHCRFDNPIQTDERGTETHPVTEWMALMEVLASRNRSLLQLCLSLPHAYPIEYGHSLCRAMTENKTLLRVTGRLEATGTSQPILMRRNRILRQNVAAVAIDMAFQRANAGSPLVKSLAALLVSNILPLDEYLVPFPRKSAPSKRKLETG